MQKLVDGVRRFQANIFSAKRHLFEKLAEGQDPQTVQRVVDDICGAIETASRRGAAAD